MADKIKVETTGEFMLTDIFNGQLIPHDKAVEVEMTPFIEQALADKRLKLSKAEAAKEQDNNGDGPSTGKTARK